MEENNPQTPNDSSQAGQVMDVKVTPAPVDSVEATGSNETAPTAQPVAVTEDSIPGPASQNSEQQAQPESSSTSEPPSNLPAPAAPSGHKAAAPLMAIIAAILVALGLAAVTVYAYMKSQDEAPKSTETSQTETQDSVPAATSADVDQASGEVDEALNASEEADFPDSELTDQSLGL